MAPTYERPAAPVADTLAGQSAKQGSPINQLAWQTFIVDPDLRRLVVIALDNNRSLRQTLLDIEQARAQYRIQRADQVPGLSVNDSGNRQRLPADLASDGRAGVASNYQVSLSLPEYELDLFGRVKSLSYSALQEYLATEEAARAAQIALVAEVSQAYLIHERSCQTRAGEHRQRDVELAKARYEGGVDSHLRYLDAQRTNFVNETAFIEVSTQRQIALVDLFRSLGGGWSPEKS